VTLGYQHLAAALDDELPPLIALGDNAGRLASGRIAQPPDRYR
jgi:hypothetical protein